MPTTISVPDTFDKLVEAIKAGRVGEAKKLFDEFSKIINADRSKEFSNAQKFVLLFLLRTSQSKEVKELEVKYRQHLKLDPNLRINLTDDKDDKDDKDAKEVIAAASTPESRKLIADLLAKTGYGKRRSKGAIRTAVLSWMSRSSGKDATKDLCLSGSHNYSEVPPIVAVIESGNIQLAEVLLSRQSDKFTVEDEVQIIRACAEQPNAKDLRMKFLQRYIDSGKISYFTSGRFFSALGLDDLKLMLPSLLENAKDTHEKNQLMKAYFRYIQEYLARFADGISEQQATQIRELSILVISNLPDAYIKPLLPFKSEQQANLQMVASLFPDPTAKPTEVDPAQQTERNIANFLNVFFKWQVDNPSVDMDNKRWVVGMILASQGPNAPANIGHIMGGLLLDPKLLPIILENLQSVVSEYEDAARRQAGLAFITNLVGGLIPLLVGGQEISFSNPNEMSKFRDTIAQDPNKLDQVKGMLPCCEWLLSEIEKGNIDAATVNAAAEGFSGYKKGLKSDGKSVRVTHTELTGAQALERVVQQLRIIAGAKETADAAGFSQALAAYETKYGTKR